MEGDDEKAKLQQYLDKIPSLTRLDCIIESEEELCCIADKLTDWESKYYLLKLTYNEVSDIKSQFTRPALQRREAVQKWKVRAGVDCTYKNFLKICVKGEWHDSAMVIVSLLKKYGGLTVGEHQAAAMAKEVDLMVPYSSMSFCDNTLNLTGLAKPVSAILTESNSVELSRSLMDLEFSFSDLAEGLLSLLKSNGTCVEKLTSCISLLPRSINVYVFPMWQKICKRINHDDTLDSLFAILNMEIWNILDYNLLEYFIKRLGNVDLQKGMTKYISKLNQFKKNTLVVEFIECWEGHNREIPDYEEVIVKFNKTNLTLADLDEFRKKLRRKCFPSLLDFAGWIYYKHFERGCFIVSWELPVQLAILLKEHVYSMYLLLEEYEVRTIMLRDMLIYTSARRSFQSDRSLSLPNLSSMVVHQTRRRVFSLSDDLSVFTTMTATSSRASNILPAEKSKGKRTEVKAEIEVDKPKIEVGIKRMFIRKDNTLQTSLAISPLSNPSPTVPEDSLGDTQVNVQANKALFLRMLKGKKIRSFRRTKRLTLKQHHSDDGYMSDPGILREEDDDETDNDPDVVQMRQLTQIKDLQTKIEEVQRTIVADEDKASTQDTDECWDTSEKHTRLGLRLHIGKSRSYQDQQRMKIEKWEGQLKELQDGGTLDSELSKGARFKFCTEDGLKEITHRKFIKGLTNAGSKFRRKRVVLVPGEEVIDDEDDEQLLEEDDEQLLEEDDMLVNEMREEQEALRLASETYAQDIGLLKEQLMQHQNSLQLIVEELKQERDRGEHLKGQLNDITELHQHEMSDLRAQLTQIENSAITKGQKLKKVEEAEETEETVELFSSKVDAHVMKVMDSSDVPDVKQRLIRSPMQSSMRSFMRSFMASLLSLLLVVIAFIPKVVSIIRAKTVLHLVLIVIFTALLGLWWYGIVHIPFLWTEALLGLWWYGIVHIPFLWTEAPLTVDDVHQTSDPPLT